MTLSSKYLGLGLDMRLLFEDNMSRFDAGPELKIGYIIIWLEYTPNFLVYNNFLRKNSDTETMDFNKIEHSINLTLSIPIVKLKNQ